MRYTNSHYITLRDKLPLRIILKSNRSNTQQAVAQDSNDKPSITWAYICVWFYLLLLCVINAQK